MTRVAAMPAEIRIIALTGIPDVVEGDDIASLILSAMPAQKLDARDLDVFVIAQKIISKAEGRIVHLASITPSALARQWASAYDKDPRVVEVVLRESKRIVRMDRGILIAETSHGFICANAGVDASNVARDFVALLPADPDASARQIRGALEQKLGLRLGVIISDTFGRPWREGLVNVALGVAGLEPIIDLRGKQDWYGQPLHVTAIALADELASSAELVMKKDSGIPAAIIRGINYQPAESDSRQLIRAPELDLFR